MWKRIQRTCAQHGAYDALLLPNGIETKCPQCVSEARRQEEAARKKQVIEQILANSMIPERYRGKRLKDLKVTQDNQAAIERMVQFVREPSERSFIFLGPPGVGKTQIACSTLIEFAYCGKRVSYVTVPELMRVLRRYDEARDHWFSIWTRVDLLVIDEIGMQLGTESENIVMFDVVNARYSRKLPTIFCSNLDKERFLACIGELVADRLREQKPVIIHLGGKSFRAQKDGDGNEKAKTRNRC